MGNVRPLRLPNPEVLEVELIGPIACGGDDDDGAGEQDGVPVDEDDEGGEEVARSAAGGLVGCCSVTGGQGERRPVAGHCRLARGKGRPVAGHRRLLSLLKCYTGTRLPTLYV